MKALITALLVFVTISCSAQAITTYVPAEIDTTARYLFYLHGGIVQEQGANAISKDFGPYEYQKIIDSLKSHGFNIISDVRPKGTKETDYARTVSKQIDSLLKRGLPAERIIVVGASQGAYISIEIAHMLQNSKINYVLLAFCNEYNLNYYKKLREYLCGNFLSVYEKSDSKGSCKELLKNSACNYNFHEVKLNMGNGHGFIFKPYKEWVYAIVEWAELIK